MAGIDYTLAPIHIREKFSFTKSTLQVIYNDLLKNENIFGAVIISTCNRTELYLSCEDGLYINPFELLCDAVDFDYEKYSKFHTLRTGDDVIRHLCELACGVKSQIWGEDQIITQVKNAIELAREMNASDSTLEVMFRIAVTSAKKVKSVLKLSSTESSIAYSALKIIKSKDNIKKALVIGNGEIGRLMASILTGNGYDTTITLRHYRHSDNIIPLGAKTIEYGERYKKLKDCDVVISATLSPHYTLEIDRIDKMRHPCLFIDLAVPRDIDPNIKSLSNAELYDVDSIYSGEVDKNHAEQLAMVNEIIDKYIFDYYRWYEYRKRLVLT
jgi:glutamyl-tRNA reductase